jgi:hypothetical protein
LVVGKRKFKGLFPSITPLYVDDGLVLRRQQLFGYLYIFFTVKKIFCQYKFGIVKLCFSDSIWRKKGGF